MGIIVRGNPRREIANVMNQAAKDVVKVITDTLSFVGEYAASLAKQGGSYTDRTGNLRSSVGYLVAVEGQVVDIEFAGPGADEGEDYALSLLAEISAKYVLIVVAGMDYASFVEHKDYQVLLFTETEAKEKAKELFEQLAV